VELIDIGDAWQGENGGYLRDIVLPLNICLERANHWAR
jgi:hypothetical protein